MSIHTDAIWLAKREHGKGEREEERREGGGEEREGGREREREREQQRVKLGCAHTTRLRTTQRPCHSA